MQSCFPVSLFSWLRDSIPLRARSQPAQQSAPIEAQCNGSRDGYVDTYHRRFHHWHYSIPRPLPSCRYRSLTLPLVLDSNGHSHEYVHDQCQSSFFRKLPAEIRESIYQGVLGDPYSVVHLTVMFQRMCHIRCWVEQETYQLSWQHPCWGKDYRSGVHCGRGDDDPPEANLSALLKTCHRMYVFLSVDEAVLQAD